MIKVLFVCMGNICRSPSAEGVFRDKVSVAGLSDRIYIDSAGTHAYHVGNPPDPRSQEAAIKRDFDLSAQRARKVEVSDFDEFDYVIAMGGTISGEHGVGITKSPFLYRELDPRAIELMQQIKRLFDPNNILNPGKIFPDSASVEE